MHDNKYFAFARPFSKDDYNQDYPVGRDASLGLTKVEYFAAAIIPAVIAEHNFFEIGDYQGICKMSVHLAKMLAEELEK